VRASALTQYCRSIRAASTARRVLPGPYFCVLAPYFFFNDTAPTEIYTLSLHDALPISAPADDEYRTAGTTISCVVLQYQLREVRSEEHTSELQSRRDLVCRLLLEKKKKTGAVTAAAGPAETS